jgi:hypothetical protein
LSSRRVEPGPPPERTFWELLPRRNFRRALLLLAALVAVIVIRQMGGFSFSKMFDSVAPPSAPTPSAERPFQHLEVKR